MRFPNDEQRISLIGSTGSGKTVAALDHLSRRNFHQMPWIIYDFKRDKMIAEIPAQELSVNEMPEAPGLYVVHPLPGQPIDIQLWQIWEHENIGIYVDEVYMMGQRDPAWRAILTQGRSKRIPVISNMQRPKWVDGFNLSESDFIQLFRLNFLDDRKTVAQWMPDIDISNATLGMPKYCSYYYNVGEHELSRLKPFRPFSETLRVFQARLRNRREQI